MKKSFKILSLLISICLIVNSFSSLMLTVLAEDSITVEITSFNRGPQDDLRASELLAATVTGYSGNAHDLTYKWTNGLGTYLYVYNSHNMYGINNTDGEIEIYNNNIEATADMAGRSYKDSFTGKGYGWAAIYGANLSSSDLLGTITVEVYDDAGNLLATDSHTGTREQTGSFWFIPIYTYYGFVEPDLEDDISNIAFGLFEGDTKHINDLLGENAMVHVTCAECAVPSASVTDGSEYISVVSQDGTYSIQGVKKGSGTISMTVEKSNCKFHQNTSATTNVTVHVYKKPTTTSTATAIMLSNLDDDCTYYINHTTGVRTTDEDGNPIVLFEGLTPNTEYQIGVKGEIEGSDPAYAFVYETTKPAHIGIVEVILNGSYDMQTGTATGTRVAIGDMIEGAQTIYLRYEDSEIYFPLETNETGIYSAVLSDGTYTMYYDNNASSKISDQELSIVGASRTRELFFNSVTYNLAGGTGGPQKLTEYYVSESKVMVSSEAPSKDGYIFSHWTDEEGNIYNVGDTLTNTIAKAYTLTANYIEATDVYVHIKINHNSADGKGHNSDNAMHNITFTVDSRTEGEAEYEELVSKTIEWDGSSEFTYDGYSAQFVNQNDVDYTIYTAQSPVLTNVEKAKEYTFTTAKSGYEISSITQEYDENGNLQMYVELVFNPNCFDVEFTVELDEEAKKVLEKFKPVAANVKIIGWYDTPYDEDYGQADDDHSVKWYTISQQRETHERVALGADGTGSASYPVWIETTDSHSVYHYRMEVVSFELADGSIMAATDVDNAHTAYVTADARYRADIEVTGGKDPVASDSDTLAGVWYENGAQQGSMKAIISIEVFDVALAPNGGTLNSSSEQTLLEGQIEVPDLSGYVPVREGGYVFDGWYYADANGNITQTPATAGDELHQDVVIMAKWKEPLTIKGTVTVASTYILTDEETGETSVIEIPEHDRASSVTVVLQKIDLNGYPETVSHLNVPITFGENNATGTYEFTGVADLGEDYRIKIISANYEIKYQNELSSSVNVNDHSAYDDTHYIAELNGDKVATVNAYLQFAPISFPLKYKIDASYIGEAFRPEKVETLILCNGDNHTDEPQQWPPISQMVTGDGYKGQNTTLTSGVGENSFNVWSTMPDGITLYDYAIKVKSYTADNVKTEFVESEAPFRITYNGHARYDEVTGQTQELVARFVPRMYTITYDFGEIGEDVITNMDEYINMDGAFTDYYYWSIGKAISASPKREGYKFLGWQDEEGNSITGIAPEMHENITLYAQWSKINAEFEVLTDAGYYSAAPDSASKVGVISLNALLKNFADIKDSIEEFGLYIYDSAQTSFKATAKSADLDSLSSDEGYFHAIISDIAPENFGKAVAAVAYVVVEGHTIISDVMQTTVAAINKWLGENNPY